MTHEDQQRRSEDRDRDLNKRLDALERKVQELDNSVNSVKQEQTHLKEIFAARFAVIEKGQELGLSELKAIAINIANFTTDPERSPIGRQMLLSYRQLEATCGELQDSIKKHEEWQTSVNTVIAIVKWVGISGVVAIIVGIIKLLKSI